MNDIEKAAAAESIRQAKAQYWTGVDMKDEALLADAFTDDAIIDFRSEGVWEEGAPLPDRHAFAKRCVSTLRDGGVRTTHQGHNPYIVFESDIEAKVIWPMEDNLWVDRDDSRLPFKHLHGYGFYHERYRRTDNGWKISQTRLDRVNVEMS